MKSLVSLSHSVAVGGGVFTAGVAPALAKCSLIECGTNSPIIDSFPFHELNEAGLPNEIGLRLRDLVSADGNHPGRRR